MVLSMHYARRYQYEYFQVLHLLSILFVKQMGKLRNMKTCCYSLFPHYINMNIMYLFHKFLTIKVQYVFTIMHNVTIR